jgi:hypothetical protein
MAKLKLAAPIAAEVQRHHGLDIPGSKEHKFGMTYSNLSKRV